MPSQATSGCAQQRRHGVGGRRPCPGSRARPARRCGASATSRTVAPSTTAEGALGADQGPGEVAAVLGQQVLERVAGDLAAEAAELGADGGEVRADQARRSSASVGAARAVRRPSRSPVAGEHVEPDARCPRCGRSRARASRRRCCRSSRRSCSGCAWTGRGRTAARAAAAACCRAACTTPGSTARCAASGSIVEDPVEVPGDVDHDAGARPRCRRSTCPRRAWSAASPVSRATATRRDDLVDVRAGGRRPAAPPGRARRRRRTAPGPASSRRRRRPRRRAERRDVPLTTAGTSAAAGPAVTAVSAQGPHGRSRRGAGCQAGRGVPRARSTRASRSALPYRGSARTPASGIRCRVRSVEHVAPRPTRGSTSARGSGSTRALGRSGAYRGSPRRSPSARAPVKCDGVHVEHRPRLDVQTGLLGTSRRSASRGSSPWSMPPPGSVQRPRCGCRGHPGEQHLRVVDRAASTAYAATPLALRGSSPSPTTRSAHPPGRSRRTRRW